MWRITVELLPHGDETKPEVVAQGKICNLRRHPSGAEVGDFHAFFEANEVPMRSELPPYLPDDPRKTYHLVADGVTANYPRFQGSVWDLIATMLTEAGRGRPRKPGGLTLEDVPT